MHDAPLEAHEHTEHLAHEGHAPDRFVSRLAVLVAAFAVFAAVAGNLEAIETAKALGSTGEATLAQDEATDAWSEYQADSVKKHLYTVAAALNPAKASDYVKQAKDETAKQDAIKTRAKKFEEERSKLVAEAHAHEERHHWLSGAATLFEIAIALTTVSLVTRKNWLWQAASVLGIVGAALGAVAFL
ncbi:hypothetical protein FHS83_000972 [Rhizomicrobium palustre]|uniref:DUF4337 domain-containing protein n=1 Tax=Rhizomicrobium palustre TaxID=189966 RepID=A0A846MVX5_9PROT|nr:DUF4337 family protein [Rhizomicrobium palustre]NIK87654.1 hypothetical protein [Rhizomicrobium palustre]